MAAIDVLGRDESSRKRFLSMVGGAGAAGALSILLSACGSTGSPPENARLQGAGGATPFGEGDLGIVNFALTLEYLESSFYKRVLDSGFFSGSKLDLFKLIANDEEQHVTALKAAATKLGKPVEPPQTNFPFKDPGQVMALAAELENTGAAAYLGQADQIENLDILAVALSIHTIEARHAGELNRLTGQPFTPDGPLASAMTREKVIHAVQPYIA